MLPLEGLHLQRRVGIDDRSHAVVIRALKGIDLEARQESEVQRSLLKLNVLLNRQLALQALELQLLLWNG